MTAAKNISNQRFGRLVAIEPTATRRWKNIVWRCRCDCGNDHLSTPNSLLAGTVRSCGCLLRETASAKARTHGDSKSRTYKVWSGMIQRCNNPDNTAFMLYGAKGISVCERWLLYENFLKDMGDRPEGRTLDRIDGTGNYEPTNCRWANALEQSRNRPCVILNTALATKIKSLRAAGMSAKRIAKALELPLGPVNGVVHLGNWPDC